VGSPASDGQRGALDVREAAEGAVTDDEINKAREAYREALSVPWTLEDERFATVKKLIERITVEVEEQILYAVQDNMASNIAHNVATCAERAIQAVLRGDEDQFRRWIYADKRGYTGREKAGEVIHGKLFETSAIALRRKLVDAYPELLKDERILDLEAQVAALIETNQKQNVEIERLRREIT
jgi:hypothetical protein